MRTATLSVLLLTATACGQMILIHDDSDTVGGVIPQPGPAEAACISLGLTHTVTHDWPTFETQLNTGGPWDIAIMLHVNLGGVPTTGQLDSLNAYMASPCSRVIYQSWTAGSTPAHPFFTTIEATPTTGAPAIDQNAWVPADPYFVGIPNPAPLMDYVGFGTDTVYGEPSGAGVALMGETLMPSPNVASVIVNSTRTAAYLGLMPHLLSPFPATGDLLLENMISDMLALPIGAGDFLVGPAGMTVNPPSPVSPGGTFGVDIEVESTAPTPEMVTVDIYFGPGEPLPSIPGVGTMTTTVMVPAMGTAVASFTGIMAPASPEAWRIHGVVNSDLGIIECNVSNNFVSDQLCIAGGGGCAMTCGDCDESGSLPVTVLDALVGAQIAAALAVPNMNQMCVCDVNDSGLIDVIDALLMAQDAAGLMPGLTCPGGAGGGAPGVAIIPPTGGTDPVPIEFDICGPPAIDVLFQFSVDAGVTFSPATAAGALPNPAPGLAPGTYTFDWDSATDVPFGTRPATADFAVIATDPVTMMPSGATFTPIPLAAGICSGTVEADLTGMALPISVSDDTSGADDTVPITCGAGGGGDHVYSFIPPMTATYNISLCIGTSYDCALEVREMDCLGTVVTCLDDSCGLQTDINPTLNAGTPYLIVVDSFSGGTGAYTLTIN